MPPDNLPDTVAAARALGREVGISPQTAQALIGYVLGRRRAWVLAHGEEALTQAQAAHIARLMNQAAEGQPLAQLTGEREFFGRSFVVSPNVLIPRPETEQLVEEVLAWANMHPAPHICDVGVGSGTIAVTLAAELPGASITAVDVSPQALNIAQQNAHRHGVEGRIRFVESSLLDGVEGPFDVIAANLPYIATDVLATLDVSRWEPHEALDGGPDGLDLIRDLLRQAPGKLASPGLLILEIGYDQGKVAAALCRAAFPEAAVEVLADFAGHDRLVKVTA